MTPPDDEPWWMDTLVATQMRDLMAAFNAGITQGAEVAMARAASFAGREDDFGRGAYTVAKAIAEDLLKMRKSDAVPLTGK